MTGLDKIIEHIKQDAQAEADSRVAEAEKKTAAMKAAAAEELNAMRVQAEERNRADASMMLERGKSAAQLAKRKLLLTAKQEIISDMLEAAKKSLLELPEEAYFEIIGKMAARYRLPGKGELLLSGQDYPRVPASFIEKMKTLELTVSKETRQMNGGFILLYGDIEENCSFDALFSDAKEALQDKVRDLLFANA